MSHPLDNMPTRIANNLSQVVSTAGNTKNLIQNPHKPPSPELSTWEKAKAIMLNLSLED
ncbi:MAG: hypothetical protein OSA51_03955 [Octadecabacter sp.]|nr:hypothetical protein [Octadecabacter sp.]